MYLWICFDPSYNWNQGVFIIKWDKSNIKIITLDKRKLNNMNKNTVKTQILRSWIFQYMSLPHSVKTVITNLKRLPLACLFRPVSGCLTSVRCGFFTLYGSHSVCTHFKNVFLCLGKTQNIWHFELLCEMRGQNSLKSIKLRLYRINQNEWDPHSH